MRLPPCLKKESQPGIRVAGHTTQDRLGDAEIHLPSWVRGCFWTLPTLLLHEQWCGRCHALSVSHVALSTHARSSYTRWLKQMQYCCGHKCGSHRADFVYEMKAPKLVKYIAVNSSEHVCIPWKNCMYVHEGRWRWYQPVVCHPKV